MSKEQLEAILRASAEAPPPADQSPGSMRAWFEAINAETPLAPGVAFAALNPGPWSGEWVRPEHAREGRLLIYYHGGGFLFGSSRSHRVITSHLAQAAEVTVLSVDYRLAPEHPAPVAHDDGFAAYRWALEQGFAPSGIALAGDSAGGNLALCTALRAKSEGLPVPGRVVAMSPALDFAGEGASHRMEPEPPLLQRKLVAVFNQLYLGQGDLKSPSVTPLYSDLSGMPPTLLHVGDWELLRDDSVTFAERMREAGSPVELKVWPGMVHCWQLFGPMLEESMQSLQELAAFIAH